MAIPPDVPPRRKPLSAAEFAAHLLSVVRPLLAEEALKNALRAQLAAPHVTRFEVRLLEAESLVVAVGASRHLNARQGSGALRVPASAAPLAGALDSAEPLLREAAQVALLVPPEDTTRVALTRVAAAGRVRGLMLTFWDHPENDALDQRLLAREAMLAGHLGIALEHAEACAILREAAAAPAPASGPTPGEGILRDEEIRALEQRNLLAALRASGGKVSGPGGAAERLGVNPSTLASRVRALGLARGAWSAPNSPAAGVRSDGDA